MNRRYQLFAENRHRNIEDYNTCQEVHEEGREMPGHQKMPVIVIVIDELADLMMAAGKEVEVPSAASRRWRGRSECTLWSRRRGRLWT